MSPTRRVSKEMATTRQYNRQPWHPSALSSSPVRAAASARRSPFGSAVRRMASCSRLRAERRWTRALGGRLGREAHGLVLAARREAELNEVARRTGAETLVVPTDVTRRADVERLRDRAIARFGAVDVWINNAGRGITKPTLDLTDEEFDLMMSVNVKSALYGMQSIVPPFGSRGAGHVINVSSFLSRVPFATYRSAYNAAKAALNALTANARVDLARTHPGIHVTLVILGLVATDFGRNADRKS